MGVRQATVSSTVVTNAVLVTSAETVVAISPPLNIPIANAQILLFGYVLFSAGTGTSFMNCKVRRGITTAGQQVNQTGSINVTVAGGNIWTFTYADTPGEIAGQQYCMTLSQTAASANGTVLDVCFTAMAL